MHLRYLIAFVAIYLAALVCGQKRGAELRLTAKGLDYTIQEALKILVKDLNGKRFKDFSGSSGKTSYNLKNLVVRSINIGHGSLTTSSNRGLTASVSGISTNIHGRLKYVKKIFWGMKIQDTVDINARASSVSFSMSINIGKSSDGKPTITVNSCSSNVGSLSLSFSGSKVSWLYNLFSGMIEGKLKGQLSDMMCRSATESLRKRGAAELAEFQVKKAIDNFAIVDYSMTAAPKFTSQFMDIFVRGEFLSKKNPGKHSSMPVPNFPVSVASSKMVYIWLSDYTVNTAGEIYHNGGFFTMNVDKNSQNIPPVVKHLLNTKRFRFLVPELARRFPNRPLAVLLHSYKAPQVKINNGEIYFLLYVAATFKVQLKNGQYFDVFSLQMDVKTDATVSVSGKKIHADLKGFSLQMRTAKSNVGPVHIPVTQPFIKNLVSGAIIKASKKFLKAGFPLPSLNDITFINPEIKLEKGVIRVGVDCLFTPK